MCFMNEIPEKEALKPKKMEKEKHQDKSHHEEKPIMVNTA